MDVNKLKGNGLQMDKPIYLDTVLLVKLRMDARHVKHIYIGNDDGPYIVAFEHYCVIILFFHMVYYLNED